MSEFYLHLLTLAVGFAALIVALRNNAILRRFERARTHGEEIYKLTKSNAELANRNSEQTSRNLCKIEGKAEALPVAGAVLQAVAEVPQKTADMVVQAMHSDSGVLKKD